MAIVAPRLTAEQKLFEIECLKSAVRALETAIFRAYFSSQGAEFRVIHGRVLDCLKTVRMDIVDKCPDGSQPDANGMCEFPPGSGNMVPKDEACASAEGSN